ncbi:MAG: PIG-L family deacetylase [Acidimicrobiia bacterium]
MRTSNIELPRRVLVVPAHPDDAEFGCAATVAKWTANGASVTYVVITDGSKGTWRLDIHPFDLALRREEEQRHACDVLGIDKVYFSRHRDGNVVSTDGLVREVATWIRSLRPDVILTHDPWAHNVLHPDHREVGRSVCDAVVAARDPRFLEELAVAGVLHHRPKALLLWDAGDPNHIEEISVEHLDKKIEALLAHKSQFQSTMHIQDPDGPDVERFAERIRRTAREHGSLGGFALGEAFRFVDPAS